jgi:hypothetical protein
MKGGLGTKWLAWSERSAQQQTFFRDTPTYRFTELGAWAAPSSPG